MRQYLYETTVLVICSMAILHGIFNYVADIGRPQVAYSDTERQQLNWLVMHSTRNINGKYQGRVNE